MIQVKVTKAGKYIVVDGDKTLNINTIIKDGDREVLKLPENSANRKYVDKKAVDEQKTIELDYKATRTLGERSATGSAKKWTEYLTAEEKKTIDDLIKKAKERYEAEKNDPKAQLKAKIAALQKKLEELQK